MGSIVYALVGGFLVVSLGTVGFGWIFAWLWCRPRRLIDQETPADHGLAHESVRFDSRGDTLSGWFIAPDRAPAPVVVLAHGWSRNAAQMLPLARPLHDAGYAVLLYDARGHGASTGRGFITIRTMEEDLRAALDYCQTRQEVDGACIGVIGHSMGAASAINAASRDPRIRALVSSSAFADIPALTRRTLRQFHVPAWPFFPLVRHFIERATGEPMVQLSPQNQIGRVLAPVLLMHGAADRFVPPAELDDLHARANGNSIRVLLPNRRHSDVMDDKQYLPEVIRFLTGVLPRNG